MNDQANARAEARDHNRRAASRRWIVRLASWTFVAIPALWGVAQVVTKSFALFR